MIELYRPNGSAAQPPRFSAVGCSAGVSRQSLSGPDTSIQSAELATHIKTHGTAVKAFINTM